ncbi:hypothetical protein AB0C34_18160 [Nocardia sp. NPDC049220]|uniref:hypothetical protein n=1 Tax=Nocardia sp. NPDC049220 TaxID=3155273 RepID=UPI0033F6AA8A
MPKDVTEQTRPDLDTHLRLEVPALGIVMNYAVHRTAARNFMAKLGASHSAILAVVIDDGVLPATRMPCEELWR